MTIDKNKSFEVENGFIVIDDNIEGPFYTGGLDIPNGLDLPINTIYTQVSTDGITIWRKFGTDTSDWTIHDGNLRRENNTELLIIPSETEKLFPRLYKINGQLKVKGTGRFL